MMYNMDSAGFVIWGIGIYGKVAFDFLGAEKVTAFIDTNREFVGKSVLGKPVIDLDTYSKNYRDAFIIVSPRDSAAIVTMLKQRRISNYAILFDILY